MKILDLPNYHSAFDDVPACLPAWMDAVSPWTRVVPHMNLSQILFGYCVLCAKDPPQHAERIFWLKAQAQ
eukprot:14074021-Heterocapsa_arctica.AAC.1